jgi:predicted HTH domain antitoxin
MTTTISIPIDSSILLSLKTGKDEFTRELLFNNALMLYRQERLSLGKAAQLAGYSRMGLIEELQRRGEPIFDFDTEHTQFLSEQSHVLHELLAKEQGV